MGSDSESRALSSVVAGTPIVMAGSFGDTWCLTTGADDALYTSFNDGLGFPSPGHPGPPDINDVMTEEERERATDDYRAVASNLSAEQLALQSRRETEAGVRYVGVSRIGGQQVTSLRGRNVNLLDDFSAQDRVIHNPVPWTSGVDGRTWKSTSLTYVDGAHYLSIGRHHYGDTWGDSTARQTARNATLIRSTDAGATWQPGADRAIEAPMFPGTLFATPYLLDYGAEDPEIDQSHEFVYASSNDGYWDNGNRLIIGRVRRDHLAHLSGSDWQYFTGGDGTKDGNWSSNVTAAQPILQDSGRIGESAVAYLRHFRRYLLITWYYPAGSGHFRGANHHSVWTYHEAPHPWGPWSEIGSKEWNPEGFYCPVVVPRFDEGYRVYVATSGFGSPEYYRLHLVPLDIS